METGIDFVHCYDTPKLLIMVICCPHMKLGVIQEYNMFKVRFAHPYFQLLNIQIVFGTQLALSRIEQEGWRQ